MSPDKADAASIVQRLDWRLAQMALRSHRVLVQLCWIVALCAAATVVAACRADAPRPTDPISATNGGGDPTLFTGQLGGARSVDGVNGCVWLEQATGGRIILSFPEEVRITFDPVRLAARGAEIAKAGDTVTVTGAFGDVATISCALGERPVLVDLFSGPFGPLSLGR